MSAVLPPVLPDAQLDAMVDYVLALREECVAAGYVCGFTKDAWERIEAIIGPLPPSVLVVVHNAEGGTDAKPPR